MGEPNQQVLEEAATWFVECRLDDFKHARREEFMAWLRRSPDHVRAYLEVSRTYVQLPGEGVLPEEETALLLDKARARLGAEVIHLNIATSRPARREPHQDRRVSLLVALAAGLIIAFSGAIGVWSMIQRGVYTTVAGEQRTVTLVDGSRIELDGRTRLRVTLTARERSVRLLEGQGLFQVAKDKSRPFIVHSGTAQIRAVGTAFDVHKEGTETTVTVLEGTVEVLSSGSTYALATDGSPPGYLMVAAGEQMVVTSQGGEKPHAANVSAATAWTRGQLEFDETPLSQVAEEFNRSSPRPLVLAGEGVGSVRISGVYSSVDPGSLVIFLMSQPDLEVIESPDQILISVKVR